MQFPFSPFFVLQKCLHIHYGLSHHLAQPLPVFGWKVHSFPSGAFDLPSNFPLTLCIPSPDQAHLTCATIWHNDGLLNTLWVQLYSPIYSFPESQLPFSYPSDKSPPLPWGHLISLIPGLWLQIRLRKSNTATFIHLHLPLLLPAYPLPLLPRDFVFCLFPSQDASFPQVPNVPSAFLWISSQHSA